MTTTTADGFPASPAHRDELIARLAIACIFAAIVSGILNGIWELASPNFANPDGMDAVSSAQRLGHGLLEVIKTVGFLAGLFGFWLAATKRGRVTKAFLGLAVLGGIVFAGVQLWIAVTGHFTLIYVLGGMWYQMVAPVALGIAALSARRVAWWISTWAILVGLINSQIFAVFAPGYALIIQGVIWLIFGYLTYTLRPPTSLIE
jgi:hypothetical protein